MTDKLICCLCGKECEDKYGNNPEPLMENNDNNRCCNECNDSKVIPARIANMAVGKPAREIIVDKNDNK